MPAVHFNRKTPQNMIIFTQRTSHNVATRRLTLRESSDDWVDGEGIYIVAKK